MHHPHEPPPADTTPAEPRDGTAVVTDDSPASRTALSQSAAPVRHDDNDVHPSLSIRHWIYSDPNVCVCDATIQALLDATDEAIADSAREAGLGRSIFIAAKNQVYEIELGPVAVITPPAYARLIVHEDRA
jgi:hypothetical protein